MIEIFDSGKIIRVLKAAGLDQVEAEKLTAKIINWLNERAKSQVTSLQIRDRVIIEIQKVDRAAAKRFISYEKYKDKNYDFIKS